MMVVDASILASALADDEADGERLRARLAGERLFAPELVDLEVASVWRRAARSGKLGEQRALQALADLAAIPLVRAPHQPLMSRIWELRDNLTSYDAAYIALAEVLQSPFLTADEPLSRAPGSRCQILLFR
jgi:predicted nucleic acid-binding protein